MNRRKPEQIVQLLHQIDEALGQGKKIEDICIVFYHRHRGCFFTS